jgi:hypothetical protein
LISWHRRTVEQDKERDSGKFYGESNETHVGVGFIRPEKGLDKSSPYKFSPMSGKEEKYGSPKALYPG